MTNWRWGALLVRRPRDPDRARVPADPASALARHGLRPARRVVRADPRVLRPQPPAARHGDRAHRHRVQHLVIVVEPGHAREVPAEWLNKTWTEPTVKHHPQDSRRSAAVPLRHHRAELAVRHGAELRRPDHRGRPLRRGLPREPQAQATRSPAHERQRRRTRRDRPRELRRAATDRDDAGRERPSARGSWCSRPPRVRARSARARRRRNAARSAASRTRRRAVCRRRPSDRRTHSPSGAPAPRACGDGRRLSPATMSPAPASGLISRSMLLVTAATRCGSGRPGDLGIVERHLSDVVQERRHLEVVEVVRVKPSRSPIETASAATRSRVPGGHEPAQLRRHRQRLDRLPVRQRGRVEPLERVPGGQQRRREEDRPPDADVGLRLRRPGIRSPSTCRTTRPRARPDGRAS